MAGDSTVERNRLKGNTLEQDVEDALDAGGLNYEVNKLHGAVQNDRVIQSRPDFVLADADGVSMAVIECKSKDAPGDGSGVSESAREGNQARVSIALGEAFSTRTSVYIGQVGERVKGEFEYAIDLDRGMEPGLEQYREIRAAQPEADVLLYSEHAESVVSAAEAIAQANGFERLRPDGDPAAAADDAGVSPTDLPMEPPAPVWPAPEAAPDGTTTHADHAGM